MKNDENNDKQTIKDKPKIIHGASIPFLKDMERYHSKVDVLVPFDHYVRKTEIKDISPNKWWKYLFIDSGAFSTSTGTANVELKKYINFIKKNLNKIGNYAALDVIGDSKQTMYNFKYMKKNGLHPIPVFHYGDPQSDLEYYLDCGCTYIGLGGVAYQSNKARQLFFDNIFSKFPTREKIGFHGFGIMNPSYLERYPWKSVDSSKISMVCRMGAIFCPNHLGSAVSISHKSSMKNKNRWKITNAIEISYNEQALIDLFKKYNLDYEIACQPNTIGQAERIFFSLDFMRDNIKIPNEFKPKFKLNHLF